MPAGQEQSDQGMVVPKSGTYVPDLGTVTGGTSLADALFGRVRSALLALFFVRPEETLYVREIIRLAGAGQGASLLSVIGPDLATSHMPALVAEWRVNIAYSAALPAATLAFAACGLRASRHYNYMRAIDSLGWTVCLSQTLDDALQVARRKRNLGNYEREGLVSEQEAQEMHSLATALRDAVLTWLRREHPELLM